MVLGPQFLLLIGCQEPPEFDQANVEPGSFQTTTSTPVLFVSEKEKPPAFSSQTRRALTKQEGRRGGWGWQKAAGHNSEAQVAEITQWDTNTRVLGGQPGSVGPALGTAVPMSLHFCPLTPHHRQAVQCGNHSPQKAQPGLNPEE